MATTLVMDAVVAILLIATIIFAVKLNGRLAALRNDSERLQGLIRGLQESSGAAEEAVAALKLTAGDAGRTLQNTIDQARKLDADLNFITERAGEVANRLEAGLRMQRDQQPGATVGSSGLTAAQQAAAAAAAADAKGNQSRLATLLKQAEAAEAPSGRIEPSLDRGPVRPKPRPAAPAREEAPRPPEPREAPRAAEPQSRAERDLLRALEARSRQ
ncbi:MAG: putative ATPase involved in repair [Rhodospirillales bacterium]|nr:putative ATPase involved in repair [Rhodospirillales bacterium]